MILSQIPSNLARLSQMPTTGPSPFRVWIFPVVSQIPLQLCLNSDGNLVISDGRMTYMVANTSAGNSTYAMLLDTGNLIVTNKV